MEYPNAGVYKPMGKYNREQKLMRLINVRLYELTGNDMYLWISGHFNELNKLENGKN